MLLVAGGVVLGLPVAVAAMRGLGALLYGLTPWDPVTLGGTALAIGVCGLLAAWIPARRASRVEPMSAVRFD